jgi:hypothetical protein
VGARIELGGGWMLSGAGGLNDRPSAPGGTDAIYRAGLATPGWRAVTGSASYARSALDATADLMGRDITTDEASAGVGLRIAAGLQLDAGAMLTRFNGENTNDRLLGRLALEARLNPWLRVRPRATAFRFENSAQEGYFAPDEYVLGELGVGVDRFRDAWSFSGEIAPGAQRIGSRGALKGALSGRARVGYSVAPGREIGLSFAFSNLGMERFQAGATGYRYQAAVISAAWGF